MLVLPVNRRRMNTFQHCCLCVGERGERESELLLCIRVPKFSNYQGINKDTNAI